MAAPQNEAEREEMLKRMMDQSRSEYPQGQISPDDEGVLVFAISADPATKTVKLDFGKRVKWLGMTPTDAAALAEALIKKAREVSTEPLKISI